MGRLRLPVFVALLLLLSRPASAAVAFDALSTAGAAATGDLSWTHTPVGTPRAAMCFVEQVVGLTDEIVSVTYGALTLTEVTGSPLVHDGTTDDGVVYAFFAGSSIPSSPQTVTVDVNATGSLKSARCITLTAAADTEIVDTDVSVNTESTTSPSAVLSLGGRTSFAVLVGHSGESAATETTPLTNWTSSETDMGATIALFYRYDIVGTTDVTAGWTQTNSENAVMIALAISEVSGAVSRRCLALLGVSCG